MDRSQIIFGALVALSGVSTRLQWSWMLRTRKFRLDGNGQPMHYQLLTRISWLLVLLGALTMAIGFST